MMRYLITCEHATNFVPLEFRKRLDRDFASLLKTHRGFDKGALAMAREFSRSLKAPLFEGEVSRLVIDMNRSPDNPTAFSKLIPSLSESEKRGLVRRHHTPFRQATLKKAKQLITQGQFLVHLSIHSFTPIWDAKPRPTDIGFLFDPNRLSEVEYARRWMRELKQISKWTVHANRPYRGTGDGHTVRLREELPARNYVGIEIEVNQRLLKTQTPLAIARKLLSSMPRVLTDVPSGG